MRTIADLVQARNDANERGDKALAREIYHQLQSLGVNPQAIDAGTVDEATAASVVPETAAIAEPEVETAPEQETTQAPEPPEKAVPAKPRRRKE